jgi:hemin uptake protein HemP
MCKDSEIGPNVLEKKNSAPEASIPCFDTETLFRGHKTLALIHAGQRYLLRTTRENKLILTK